MDNKSTVSGKRILLLEGFARQVMPMMEALAKLQCHVTTYNSSKLDLGYLSKYPNNKIIGFWDRNDEKTSYRALLDFLKHNIFDVVIPLTDFSATMLSRNKEEISKYTCPAVNDWDIFIKAADKLNTMIACMDNNIPAPYTLRKADTIDDVLASGIQYPFIIKPRIGYAAIGFHKINNKAELQLLFNSTKKLHGDLLVQEYIPQTGVQYKCQVFIDQKGDVKNTIIFDKTRWYPIKGGSSCCATTISHPQAIKDCLNLLQILGWRGYADIDLIQDPRDNIAKIMEINPRITGSVKICFESGVDFARQIVEYETNNDVTRYKHYQLGCTLRYMHTDLLWLLQSADRFSTNPSWFSWNNTTDQIFSLCDPLPWFGYTIQGLIKLVKRKH